MIPVGGITEIVHPRTFFEPDAVIVGRFAAPVGVMAHIRKAYSDRRSPGRRLLQEFHSASVACAHSFITVSARCTVASPSTNGFGPPAFSAASFSTALS